MGQQPVGVARPQDAPVTMTARSNYGRVSDMTNRIAADRNKQDADVA